MTTLTSLAEAPRIDLLVAAPVLAPAIGAVLVLALDALWPRRRWPAVLLGPLALVIALAASVVLRLRSRGEGGLATVCLPKDPALTVAGSPGGVTDCLLRLDGAATLLQGLAAAAGLAVLWCLVGRAGAAPPADDTDGPGRHDAGPGVDAALLLSTVAGAAVVTAAQDLGTWLVGIELATLPIVALAVLRGHLRDSGAMHLITTSVTSFAIAVVGAGLWTIGTGTIRLDGAAAAAPAQDPANAAVIALGATLLVAGVAFKLSLVPFHAWAPATYPRSGAIVALLLATVSSVAALGGLVAVVRAAIDVTELLTPLLGVLAVLSMLVGAVLALTAGDPLRLMAWSGVTQAGWVVAALAGGDVAAAVGYLAVYVLATAAVLAVVVSLAPDGRRSLEDDRGLLRRRPAHATVLGIGLLTLAGLPPGVAGLLAKIAVLAPLASGGIWWVALPAVAAAVLGIAVYLRWLALVITPARSPREVEPAGRAGILVAVVVAVVLVAVTLVPVVVLGAGT